MEPGAHAVSQFADSPGLGLSDPAQVLPDEHAVRGLNLVDHVLSLRRSASYELIDSHLHLVGVHAVLADVVVQVQVGLAGNVVDAAVD